MSTKCKTKSSSKRARVAGRGLGNAKPTAESKISAMRDGEATKKRLACGCTSPLRVCSKPEKRLRCSEHCAHRCCKRGLRDSVDALVAAAGAFTADELKKVDTLLDAVADFHSEADPDESIHYEDLTRYLAAAPAMVAAAQAKPGDYASIVDQVKGLCIEDGRSDDDDE